MSASYGDDEAGRAGDGDERDSGNEESDDDDGTSVSFFSRHWVCTRSCCLQLHLCLLGRCGRLY